MPRWTTELAFFRLRVLGFRVIGDFARVTCIEFRVGTPYSSSPYIPEPSEDLAYFQKLLGFRV